MLEEDDICGRDDPIETHIFAVDPSSDSASNKFMSLIAALNPIEEWGEINWLRRVYQVVKSPIDFLFRITVPIVDKEKPRDNWCQYLGILQCVLGPLFIVFAINIALDEIAGSPVQVWHVALIFGIVLAAIVGFTSTSNAPKYHFVFCIVGFAIAIVWIFIIANELVSLLKAFGVMFGLSDIVLGLTLLAWGNSIGDFVPDATMAMKGFPRAGFSACFGGPLFNTLLGIGIPFTIRILHSGAPISLSCDMLTLVLSIGLAASLSFSYIYMPFMKFQATKLYGIILICIYVVFLIACLVTEFTVMQNGNGACF